MRWRINLIVYFIFLYLFAILGVSLFRLPNPETLRGEEPVSHEQYVQAAPHAPGNSPAPYGTLDESMYTLFRAMTGDDWSDLRYNLLTAGKYNVVKVSPATITTYHVSRFIISALLLVNPVVGAILNNYRIVPESRKQVEKNG